MLGTNSWDFSSVSVSPPKQCREHFLQNYCSVPDLWPLTLISILITRHRGPQCKEQHLGKSLEKFYKISKIAVRKLDIIISLTFNRTLQAAQATSHPSFCKNAHLTTSLFSAPQLPPVLMNWLTLKTDKPRASALLWLSECGFDFRTNKDPKAQSNKRNFHASYGLYLTLPLIQQNHKWL